jgi:hypothetical protein
LTLESILTIIFVGAETPSLALNVREIAELGKADEKSASTLNFDVVSSETDIEESTLLVEKVSATDSGSEKYPSTPGFSCSSNS